MSRRADDRLSTAPEIQKDAGMKHQRIGEHLRHVVPLSAHDVEEVLNEQMVTHQRFGDAALALGLCVPEQLWKAWVDQLTQHTQVIDLEAVGVDVQAVTLVPAAVAHRNRALPVRASENELVVVTDGSTTENGRLEIEQAAGKRVILVTTTTAALDAALARYYPVRKHHAA